MVVGDAQATLVAPQHPIQRAQRRLQRELLHGLVAQPAQREQRHIQRWALRVPLQVILLPDQEYAPEPKERQPQIMQVQECGARRILFCRKLGQVRAVSHCLQVYSKEQLPKWDEDLLTTKPC